jgi:hypothetical protein
MPEEYDHGKNLIETRRLGLVSKSLILRVHEVLTRDRSALSGVHWCSLSTDSRPCFIRACIQNRISGCSSLLCRGS